MNGPTMHVRRYRNSLHESSNHHSHADRIKVDDKTTNKDHNKTIRHDTIQQYAMMNNSNTLTSSRVPTMLMVYITTLIMTCWSTTYAFQAQRPTTGGGVPRKFSIWRSRQVQQPSHWLMLMASSSPTPSSSGEVGEGSNWIEKSFPVGTEEKIDIKKVEDYNLGINGRDFQTGPLSRRMFDAITSRTSLDMSEEIRQAFTLYAMDFTAKEATRAALQQNGLQMVLQEEEEDQGMWGDVEAVRLYDDDDDDSGLGISTTTTMYDSLEDAVEAGWKPGQTFDFVVRQVPAKVKELSIDELVQALDPDGKLREEAKVLKGDEDAAEPEEEALLSIFDDIDINSLSDLANDCVRRTQIAPRQTTTDETAYTGSDESRGYRVISRSDLLRDSINQDGTENEKTLGHVMHALVAHGVLLVDVTDGGASLEKARQMNEMWKATETFFHKINEDDGIESELPPMTTVMETGSQYAKVGYATVDNGSMKFLETRMERETGNLLPEETSKIIGDAGVQALQSAFDLASSIGKDCVRIAVAASSVENRSFVEKGNVDNEDDQKLRASQGATLLCRELVDDGKPLPVTTKISHQEGKVSMSPHRLCSYSEERIEAGQEPREVFGAHTDSSFVTIVPVAAVSGLEVYDEEAEQWYRPELRARLHWEKEQKNLGNDPTLLHEPSSGGEQLPWYNRYIAIMPGEFLQLCTQSEVPAAVHRVVAAKGRPPRLSAPILLRGRPGTRLDIQRYLGSTAGSTLLQSVDGMTMEEIHASTQPTSYE